MQIKSFAYQLQNVDISKLSKSNYDLIVIDSEHTKQEISRLKPKKIISYISIGEAEDYRSYWQKSWKKNPPEWLGKENKEWRGNYTVKEYFHPDWWKILTQMLDEIISKGFDGIAMDKVDAYVDLGETLEMKLLMIDLVAKISEYCKKKKPGFLIIAHNCSELVNVKQYMNAIDGITQEDLVYDWNSNGISGKKTPSDYFSKVKNNLQFAKSKNKIIMMLEYVSGSYFKNTQKIAGEIGALAYSAPRDLGSLRNIV